MKLSFSTLGCPDWTVRQIVDQAKTLGFEGVELRAEPGAHFGPDESPESRRQTRAMFQDAGVEICCLMGYSMFTHADQVKRRQDIDKIMRTVELAGELGSPMVRIFGGHHDGGTLADNVARVADSLRQILPLAQQRNVRLCFETHDAWCRASELRAVLDQLDSPALGVCWDVASVFFEEPIERSFKALKDRIIHVHFKDGVVIENVYQSRLPGRGRVPMRQALRLLNEHGYDGYLSFEWEKKWEPELESPEIAFPHFLRYTAQLMNELKIARGARG